MQKFSKRFKRAADDRDLAVAEANAVRRNQISLQIPREQPLNNAHTAQFRIKLPARK